ncbi:MAG: hypothetical protein QXI09_02565 [Candidatus Aenigmatarchaeota archaeon]
MEERDKYFEMRQQLYREVKSYRGNIEAYKSCIKELRELAEEAKRTERDFRGLQYGAKIFGAISPFPKTRKFMEEARTLCEHWATKAHQIGLELELLSYNLGDDISSLENSKKILDEAEARYSSNPSPENKKELEFWKWIHNSRLEACEKSVFEAKLRVNNMRREIERLRNDYIEWRNLLIRCFFRGICG